MGRSPVYSPDRGSDRLASNKSPIRALAARAKSISAPGVRKSSPIRQSGAPARAASDPEKVRKYRQLLVEIYDKHAPEKNVNVDQLLEKYRGQEEFIYRTVCKRYENSDGKSEALDTGKAGVAASSKATKAKAALPRPPGKSQTSQAGREDVTMKNGVEAREASRKDRHTAKPVSDGKSTRKRPAESTSNLLVSIDKFLIGESTGFFNEPMELSDDSGSASQSSYSREEEIEEEEEEAVVAEQIPKAVGTSIVGQAKTKLDVQADVERSLKQQVKQTSASKSAPPKAPRTTAQATTSDHVAEETAPVSENGAQPAIDDADDSDMDDVDLAGALAARLEGNEDNDEGEKAHSPADAVEAPQLAPSAPEAQSSEVPKVASSQPELREDNSGNESPDIPASRPKKAGAPPAQAKEVQSAPTTAAKARAAKKDTNGVKPKAASESVPAKDPEAPEPEAPPLFDQFLAVLKFLTGWNDQRTYTKEEIREALCEHLADEGIRNSTTIERLCATIVPLLLDLKSIDIAVVKNVKKDILKNLKIIQIYILRIVTFELKREINAKAEFANNVKRTKKDNAQLKAALPYLSSDISSLAKTVQHFRFESAFSGGLQKLITQIRAQKKATISTKGNDGDSKIASKTASGSDAPAKRKSEASVNDKTVTDGDSKVASKTLSGSDAPEKRKSEASVNDRTGSPDAGKTAAAGDEAEKAAPPPLKRQRRMV